MNLCDPLSLAVSTATVTVSCMMASTGEKVNSLLTGQCNFCQQSYSTRWFNHWRKLEVWENANYLNDVNRHKCPMWGQERPHKIYKDMQGSQAINVRCGISHGCVTGPFFFVDSIIMANIYLAMWQPFVSTQIDGIEEQEGAILFNKMALHPTAVMRYKFPWMSDLLIGGLEKTNQQHGPPQTQTSHHLHFSVVICTKLSLHNREYLRFMSPTREN